MHEACCVARCRRHRWVQTREVYAEKKRIAFLIRGHPIYSLDTGRLLGPRAGVLGTRSAKKSAAAPCSVATATMAEGMPCASAIAPIELAPTRVPTSCAIWRIARGG